MQDFANIFGKRQNLTNLLFLLLIAIGLPVALYLVNQQQNYRSRAGGGQVINLVSDNVYEQNGKTYVKPIQVISPDGTGSTQYRYQVTLSLDPPPPTDEQTGLAPISPAFAQSNDQCTYSDACNLPLTPDTKITGSTFCKYRDPSVCTSGSPQDCFVSVNSPIPGCGLAPNDSSIDLSCKVDTSNIGIGQQATFKVSYNAALAAFVRSAILSDSSGNPTTVDGAGIPISGSKYQITLNRTYPTAFSGKPTVSLILNNNKGATLPIDCDQVSVGASPIKVALSGNETFTSGQTGQYSLNVSTPSTEATLGISTINLFALHADGTPLSAAECGNATIVNGQCQLYTNSNFQPLQKEFSKSTLKWKPTLSTAQATDYYLYAEVVTTANSGKSVCSGKRGSSAIAPCSGQSNLDVTVTTKSGYIGYAVAASLTELPDSSVRATNITSWPQIVTFPPGNDIINSWQTPGPRTIYAKFFSQNGQDLVVNRTVELVAPDPDIRAVSCNVGADGKSLSVAIKGYNFGSRNDGKLTLNGNPLNITQWKTNQSSSSGSDLIVGSLASSSSSNQDYLVELSRTDGSKSTAKCSVGVTTLNLGAKVLCRSTSSQDLTNVDVTIADGFDVKDGTKGKITKNKVSIGPDGTVKGLNAILQTCNYYKLAVKAPNSLRRGVEFQASDGQTLIPEFKLPVGDIFPAGGGDGKINSFDVAELLRQWAASPGSVRAQSTATDSATTQTPGSATNISGRTADFNQDGVVNSFDFACLVSSFNQESDPEPTPGAVNTNKIGDFCANNTDNSPSPLILISSPNPTPSSVVSSPAATATTIPATPTPSPQIVVSDAPLPSNLSPTISPSPIPSNNPPALNIVVFGHTELKASNKFSADISLNAFITPQTPYATVPVRLFDTQLNNFKNLEIKFIIKPTIQTDFANEFSPYKLSATCQPDGSVLAKWTKQADKRYRVVLYDCTNETSNGTCDPSNVVGSTEYTGADVSQTGTTIAEAFPDGNTQKLTNGQSGNYPGNPLYNVYQTQQNRRYLIQLFDRNLDNSNPQPVDQIATPEFVCSTARDTYYSTMVFTDPNTYGLDAQCQQDGDTIGALWWTMGKNNVQIDTSKLYRAVAYDCTYAHDCIDPRLWFIAGETSFTNLSEIQKGQRFSSQGVPLITRPGHNYEVQLFAKDPQTNSTTIPINAVIKKISCR